MPRYRYEANNDAGAALRGVLTAPSVAAATARLESQGLSVRSVALDDRQIGEAEAPLAAAVDRLVEARDELAEPLTAYAEEFATGRRRRELVSIAAMLREGDREAVLAAAGSDPAAWSALLAATASGASLQSQFARFVEREATVIEVRRRRRLALAYPLFIGALCLVFVWGLSLVVMPTFNAIFRDFGLELPAFTTFVLALGCFLASGGGLLILGLLLIAAVLWAFYPWWAPGSVRRVVDWLGGIRRATRSLVKARIAAHLANLHEAGLPAPSSFSLLDPNGVEMTSGGNRTSMSAIHYAMSADLPPDSRTRLLRAFAANSNEAAAEVETWTMGMAGPVSVVTLGIVVALSTIALFLPLVRLIEGLS